MGTHVVDDDVLKSAAWKAQKLSGADIHVNVKQHSRDSVSAANATSDSEKLLRRRGAASDADLCSFACRHCEKFHVSLSHWRAFEKRV